MSFVFKGGGKEVREAFYNVFIGLPNELYLNMDKGATMGEKKKNSKKLLLIILYG